MPSIINAVSGSGITQSADGSGIIKIQSNSVTTNALAWVNFNGTGTVAIRSSYNVSSITDNGTGLYTVNFATALSDANYSVNASASPAYSLGSSYVNLFSNSSTTETAPTTGAFTLRVGYSTSGGTEDLKYICAQVFGN